MPATVSFASLGMGDLTIEEKWAVVRDLQDEIDLEDIVPDAYATTEEWHAELRRRVAKADANPAASRDFNLINSEIVAELEASEREK
jgi:putative addiction module component (TIGR02574 family)